VSATTRAPRDREQDGVDYHFWDRDHFQAEVDRGRFLEWAEVHGNLYGTPRSEVEPYREQGVGVILVIDVQGAALVRPLYPDHVSAFLMTSTPDLLERRLRGRKTEDEASIQRRLANARVELGRAGEYQYQILNDDLEAAVARLESVIESHFGGDETCTTS
jgi:guanylate kinase